MFYFIIVIPMALITLWGVLVLMRKSMWDVVHRNLLDLEDAYEGTVIRNNFASRPVFHGNIRGTDFTINFSTEKSEGKRVYYVDISYSVLARFNCTIAGKKWLDEQQAGSIDDFVLLTNNAAKEFIVRPISDKRVEDLGKHPALNNVINNIDGLAYIFIGKSGILCEFETQELPKYTEFKLLNENILLLDKLGKAL